MRSPATVDDVIGRDRSSPALPADDRDVLVLHPFFFDASSGSIFQIQGSMSLTDFKKTGSYLTSGLNFTLFSKLFINSAEKSVCLIALINQDIGDELRRVAEAWHRN